MSYTIGKQHRFTAILRTNRRDVLRMSPKRLLTDIVCENGELFRDHCWVKESKRLSKHMELHKKEYRRKGYLHIEFSATPNVYGENKHNLISLRSIKRVEDEQTRELATT